jgi:radical SAM protein with 4Fe4S-binding SPASM domain
MLYHSGMTDRPRASAPAEAGPARRLDVVHEAYRPVYTVWELTLACDQRCVHCGSRAIDKRSNELTTAEALRVADELVRLGAREVALIGGEAYLHEGFLDIIAALHQDGRGARVTMTTGGRSLDLPLARRMRAAGMSAVSVSIDGLERRHDTMRASVGSFVAASQAVRAVIDVGLEAFANTNVNRYNEPDLEAVYEHVRDLGVRAWQVQLTTPLGRAADRPDMVLQPFDLVSLFPRITRLKERAFADGILLMPGNNLGYFGPEEPLLRSLSPDGADHFRGCQAGRFVLGIESDGGVKGCPSLQSKPYVGGNVKDKSIDEIWNTSPEVGFTRPRTVDDLWGFCRTCAFAEVCLGGCTFTAHALLGRPGNNPYCHYRARDFASRGRRERLIFEEAAEGLPFDNGRFRLVEEAWEGDTGLAPSPAEATRTAGLLPAERLLRRRRPNESGSSGEELDVGAEPRG